MKRALRRSKWYLLALMVILVPFLIYRVGFYFHRVKVTPSGAQKLASVKRQMKAMGKGVPIPVTLSRVIDADTLEVKFSGGEKHRVQLLGVDGPEIWHKASSANANGESVWVQTEDKEALEKREKLESFLRGKRIRLEFDTASEPVDRYGRLLAWVWVEPERVPVNASLEEQGQEILLNEWVVRQGVCVLRGRLENLKYAERLSEAEGTHPEPESEKPMAK